MLFCSFPSIWSLGFYYANRLENTLRAERKEGVSSSQKRIQRERTFTIGENVDFLYHIGLLIVFLFINIIKSRGWSCHNDGSDHEFMGRIRGEKKNIQFGFAHIISFLRKLTIVVFCHEFINWRWDRYRQTSMKCAAFMLTMHHSACFLTQYFRVCERPMLHPQPSSRKTRNISF